MNKVTANNAVNSIELHYDIMGIKSEPIWGGVPMIRQQQIDELINRIVDSIHPQKIVLFGSYANGTATDDSDLDLLILKETDLRMNHRAREILRLTRGMKIPVDIVVYTQNEIEKWRDTPNSFVSEVLKNGKILYEQ